MTADRRHSLVANLGVEFDVTADEEIEAVGPTRGFENLNTREEFERAAELFES